LVGFFVNTVVLRSQVDGRQRVDGLLAGVKETVLEAFAHQDVPFERVVEELAPVRDTSRTPLFQAMVVLQNNDDRMPRLPGLTVEELAPPTETAAFDITLEFEEFDGGLRAAVNYSTDLFEAGTVERMAGHLGVLLEEISGDPDRLVGELPMLTGVERDLVVGGWNDTGHEVPFGTVPGLFAERVRRDPFATAVVCGDESVSYRELDERADRLARRLVELGVRPEDRVGVLMDRSVEAVVAVLAIVKAGGAYLPLDVRAPASRLGLVLAEAGASVLVTDPAWAPTAREIHPGHVVVAGVPSPDMTSFAVPVDLADLPDVVPGDGSVWLSGPELVVDPEQLAYVMYTSGSTGVPKGVAVRHRDVVALVFDRRFDGGALGRVLAHSPMAFDASTYELWVPLLRGGTVVVAPPGELDPATLQGLITTHGVSA
ncbi:AMP-binding protein, partial [Planotetraspora sp. A-T 1434]|uniref:AMP-binding protein n=1 Tax=Planotetraspora sp. A-T 1434 TaxID=2979219 RepID=UPI0021C14DE8